MLALHLTTACFSTRVIAPQRSGITSVTKGGLGGDPTGTAAQPWVTLRKTFLPQGVVPSPRSRKAFCSRFVPVHGDSLVWRSLIHGPTVRHAKPWAMNRQPGWCLHTRCALPGPSAGLRLAPVGLAPLLLAGVGCPLWGSHCGIRKRGAGRTRRRRSGRAGLWGGHGCAGEPSLALVAAPTRLVGIPLPLISLPVLPGARGWVAVWRPAIPVALWSVLVRWLGAKAGSTAVLTAPYLGAGRVLVIAQPLFLDRLEPPPAGVGLGRPVGASVGAALVAAAQLLIGCVLLAAP